MPDQKKRFKILLDNTEYTDPDNWPNFTPTTQRHEIYRTLLSTFSEGTVILIKDAKDYVDSVYATYGVSQTISVKWLEYDYASDSYEEVYSIGRLNLAGGKYKRTRSTTEVGFEPTDFVQNFLNRDEITLALQDLTDLDGDAITTFTDEYHTVEVQPKDPTELTGVINSSKQDTNINQAVVSERFLEIGLDSYTKNEFSYPEFSPAFETALGSVDDQIEPASNVDLRVIIEYNIQVAFRIDETSSLNYDLVPSISLKRRITRDAGGTEDQTIATVSDSDSGSGDYDFVDTLSGTFDEDLELLANDKVKYYIHYEPGILSLNENVDYYYELTPTTFNFSVSDLTSDIAATDCKVMLPWEFFLRICQKITGRNDCLRSEFFGRTDGEVYTYASDGEGALYGISNVKQLRGFPIADNPIKTTMMHAFRQLDSIFLLGLGVTYESGTPYIIIDKLQNLMDNTDTLFTVNALDPGIEWETAINYIWSNVKCGYKNFGNDETDTLATPHSTRQYTVPYLTNTVNNEYNVEAEIIASAHLIENLRILYKYSDDPLKDTSFDENLIILELERDGSGGYQLKHDDDFDSVTNIPTTAGNQVKYNIGITPARTIRNHAPLLYCGLAKRLISNPSFSEFLKFQSGTGNTSVITDKTGEAYTIDEGEDIERNQLPDDLQGEIFDASEMGTFQAKLTKAQRQALNDSVILPILIVDGENTYKGFIESKREINLIEGKAEIKFLQSYYSPPRPMLAEDSDPIEGEGGSYFEWEG